MMFILKLKAFFAFAHFGIFVLFGNPKRQQEQSCKQGRVPSRARPLEIRSKLEKEEARASVQMKVQN